MEIIISILCISSEFEKFYLPKKPKYTDFKEYVIDGICVKEERLFTYQLKIDFDLFKSNDAKENKYLLAREIIKSNNIKGEV